jgi:hypothetical protein
MKKNLLKILTIIFVSFVMFSCNKTEILETSPIDKDKTPTGLANKADLTGKVNPFFYKTYPNVQSHQTPPKNLANPNKKNKVVNNTAQYPVFAYVNGYQVGYSCLGGQELNFNDIVTSLEGGAVGSSTINVLVMGSSYQAQFTYSILINGIWNENHYKLLHVPIFPGFLCTNPDIDFVFYGPTENFYESITTSENTCNVNGSWNPGAISNSPGSLNLFVPITLCNQSCPLAFPANYRFRYRIQGTNTWSSVLVAYPTYYTSFTTITGLPAGLYEVEGRNECAGVSPSPYVPCQFNPIQVN